MFGWKRMGEDHPRNELRGDVIEREISTSGSECRENGWKMTVDGRQTAASLQGRL
jgi:hypothetical protein